MGPKTLSLIHTKRVKNNPKSELANEMLLGINVLKYQIPMN
jgi:hypothetical protein